jgi:hypothetical protein
MVLGAGSPAEALARRLPISKPWGAIVSKSQNEYEVGYKRPPVGRPFGPDNQAARGRRKNRPGKTQMMEGLRDALLQEIQVQQKGKQRRVLLGYGIGQQIGQQLAQAPLSVKIKALADLKKHGLLELFEGEAQLDEQWAELELEKRNFARRRHDYQLLNQLTLEEAHRDWMNLRCAFQMLVQLKESDCPGFEGEFLQQYEQLREIVISRERAEELASSSVPLRELLAGDASSNDDQLDDHDLRKGMLGSD